MTKLEEIFCEEFQCELARLSEQIEYVQHRTYDINKLKNVVRTYTEWTISQTLEKLSESTDLNMFIKDDSDLMNGGYWSIDRNFIKKFRINDIL